MTGLLGGIAAVAVPLVLLVSLYGQARRPRMLAMALRAQGTFPSFLASPVAVAVVAAEAVTCMGGAAGLLLWRDGPVRLASGSAAALLGLYALYGAYVTRARSAVPCGCAGDIETPMTGWVAGRAGILAWLAVAGALWGLPDRAPAFETSIVVTAGLGFAVILWALPQAMIEERRSAG